MKIIFNCADTKSFLAHYSKLFAHATIHNNNFNSVKEPQKHGWVIKTANDCQPAFFVLNPDNSGFIAAKIADSVSTMVNEAACVLTQIRQIIGHDWDVLGHNIVIHVLLNNIYQQLWDYKINNKRGGSITLLDNPSQCKVICSSIISLRQGLIMVYPLSGLQENNATVHHSFNDDNMQKMLRSIDEEGFLIPTGNSELQLFEMKLIKPVKVKGDFASSYKMNMPTVDASLIHKLKHKLREMSFIGSDYLDQLKTLLNQIDDQHKIVMGHISKPDYLQACLYVYNHVFVEQLIDKGILAPFSAIPKLQGLGARILYTHGIS